MSAGHAARQLCLELCALHQDAGKPTLEKLVRLGRDQKPAINISDSAISDWLSGKHVPLSKESGRYFMIMVEWLYNEARRRGNRSGPCPKEHWNRLLADAHGERQANRGGRPSSRIVPSGTPEAVTPDPVVTLPPASTGFAGRDEKVQEVLTCLSPDEDTVSAVAVVVGMPGVGKTTLAVQAAHQARDRRWFPGGILFEDMRGFSDEAPASAGAVVGRLLRALGVTTGDGVVTAEEHLTVWRGLLADNAARARPLLLILDNVASARQVAALVPDAPHRLLVTSRVSLSTLPARHIDLPVLPAQEALQVFDRVLRIRDRNDARITEQQEDAHRLAALCGYLPLALRIVAAQLCDAPAARLATHVRDLADAHTRLDRLDYDDLAVRAAFDLSYSRLTEEQARAFRLLTVIPGPHISEEAAAVVLDRPMADARRVAADLARLHLLETGVGNRWGWHDLIRLYAIGHSMSSTHDDPETATGRLFDHYRTVVSAANVWLQSGFRQRPRNRFQSYDQASSWLDGEYQNLIVAATVAHETGRWQYMYALAAGLESYLELRHDVDDWLYLGRLAVDAAAHIGPAEMCGAAAFMGNACRVARRLDESVRYLKHAFDLAVNAEDRPRQGSILHNLGLAHFHMGDYEEAESCHRRDFTICTAVNDRRGAARGMVALGDALRAQKKHAEAIEWLSRALEILKREGDRSGAMGARINLALTWLDWWPEGRQRAGYIIWQLCAALRDARHIDDRSTLPAIFMNLGVAYRNRCRGCHAEAARDWSRQAVSLFRDLTDSFLEAKALFGLGEAEALMGNVEEARKDIQQGIDTLHRLGNIGHAEYGLDLLTHLDQIAAEEHAGCPDAGADHGEFSAWLEDLPHAVLRGNDDRLSEYSFDGRHVIFHGTRPPADTGRRATGPARDAPLTSEKSLTFLNDCAELDDDVNARRVGDALGHLPLALAQAAAVIRRDRLTPAAYLARLAAIQADESSGEFREHPGLAASTVLNIESLELMDRSAVAVLESLAVLASDVDRDLVLAVCAPADISDIDNAVNPLVEASLVAAAADCKCLTIHPTVQRLVRRRARQLGTLLDTAARVVGVLHDEFTKRISATAGISDALHFYCQVDALWAAAVEADLIQSESSALIQILQLRAWQVNLTISLLSSADAITTTEIAIVRSNGEALVDDCERLLGASHRETLRARNNLAGIQAVAGQYDQACALLAQNLRYIGAAEAEHPDTLGIRHNLGNMHLQAGRSNRARRILMEVLAIRKRNLGTEDPATQQTRHVLDLAEEITRQATHRAP